MRSFEQALITHASLTLCHMKLGSLFNIQGETNDSLNTCVKLYNRILEPKGIEIVVLMRREKSSLIYVYHKNKLKHLLETDACQKVLKPFGYKGHDVYDQMNQLKIRLQQDEFPHEIGVFLGYPLSDVLGFINCEKCLLIGHWKVYQKAKLRDQQFKRYNCCIQDMKRRFNDGVKLESLII